MQAQTHKHINACACANYRHTHTYVLAQVASRGSGGFSLACFQRLMWPGVFVCAHLCTCVCVLSFVSSQLNLASLPPLSAVLHIPLSLSSSPSLSLSDEQIELLNELFLWAPNAHPQLSICSFPLSVRLSLPPSTHPSTPPPPPNHTVISRAFLLQQCLYLQAPHTHAHMFTVTYTMH